MVQLVASFGNRVGFFSLCLRLIRPRFLPFSSVRKQQTPTNTCDPACTQGNSYVDWGYCLWYHIDHIRTHIHECCLGKYCEDVHRTHMVRARPDAATCLRVEVVLDHLRPSHFGPLSAGGAKLAVHHAHGVALGQHIEITQLRTGEGQLHFGDDVTSNSTLRHFT